MFVNYNYFRQYNNMQEITDYKSFYRNFSNEKEFGGEFSNIDHLVKNRFMNVFGFVNNAILRKRPKRILDIGCGNGVNLPFSNLYPEVEYHAIDYAEKTVSVAQTCYPRAHIKVMDAFNLSFNQSFDLIILSSIIILYENEESRLKILEEAKRVLAEDGIIVLVVWKDSFFLKFSMNFSRWLAKLKRITTPKDFCGLHFSEKDVGQMLKKNGLKVLNVDHTAFEYGVLEAVRYLNLRKYKRIFGKHESEVQKVDFNTENDLINTSGSPVLTKIFFRVARFFPALFSMFSVYIVDRD